MVFVEMINLNTNFCLQGMINLKVTECFNRSINRYVCICMYLYVLKMHVYLVFNASMYM